MYRFELVYNKLALSDGIITLQQFINSREWYIFEQVADKLALSDGIITLEAFTNS